MQLKILDEKNILYKNIFAIITFIVFAACMFYVLSPYRFWGRLVLSNQLEISYISFIVLFVLFLLISVQSFFLCRNKAYCITLTDTIFFGYTAYFLLSATMQQHVADFESVLGILSLSLLYLITRLVDTELLKHCLYILPFAGLCQFAYGIDVQTQNFTSGKDFGDISGIFFNTGIWGCFTAVVFLICLWFLAESFSKHRSIFQKIFFSLATLIFGFLLIISDSRSAWIGAATGVLCFVYLEYGKKIRSLFRKKQTNVILILSVAVHST